VALRDRLRQALDEDEREEREAKLDERLGKIETKIETIERAPGEDDDELAALVQQLKETRAELDALKAASTKPADDDDNEGKGKGKGKGTTRPGRKAGNAYDWDVDDDGKVIELPVARVYSGEDEPDEVALP
jgi:hypothetical protein